MELDNSQDIVNTKISRSHKKNLIEIEKKSKIKISDFVLYTCIVLTFGFLVFTIVDLFISISNKEFSQFTPNFLFSFIMIIIATIIYLFLIYFDKNKLEYPEWFKSVIIVSVLVFTIVYPLFNLFNNFWFDIVFNAILGILISIIGVSIFYNFLRDSKNIVKSSPNMVFLFAIFFTISIGVFIEFIEFLVRLLTKVKLTRANDPVIDLLTIFVASFISSLVLYISLKNKKKLINSCLIYKK